MRRRWRVWLPLLIVAAFVDVAAAQTCPPSIYLANNATTPDGMRSNGGYITFDLALSMVTGSGRTCTYSRPADPNYDPFIGRDLAADEVDATPIGGDAWLVTLTGGGARSVRCPARIEIGPVATYAPSGGGMTPLPEGWLVTRNNVQRLGFDTTSSQLPFIIRCNYRGYDDVVLYVPPPARSLSKAATGLTSTREACSRFDGPGSEYYDRQQSRRATTSWVGPGGM